MTRTGPNDQIQKFILRYRRRSVVGAIARDCAVACAAFTCLTALLQAAFALFPWVELPVLFDLSAVAFLASIAGSVLFRSVLAAPSPAGIAVMIDRRSGVKNPLLAIAFELAHDPRTRDNPFTGAALLSAAGSLDRYPSRPPKQRWTRVLWAASAVLAAWCLFNPVLSPRLFSYWNLPFNTLARLRTTVYPGSIAVAADRQVDLKLGCAARFPSCRLSIFGMDGERVSNLFLRPDREGAFSLHIDHVKSSFVYRFDLMGRSAGRSDTITVVPPPQLRRMRVTVDPPAYTRLCSHALPEGQGDLEAYTGSRVRLVIGSDRLRSARVIYGSDTLPLATTGRDAAGEFCVRASGSYTLVLADTLGQTNDRLPSFHVGCIADEPPAVQLFRPGRNKELQTDQLETLAVEGIDDLGIRSLSLKWRRGGESGGTGKRDLMQGGSGADIRSVFAWHLNELSMYPGDTVYYWAEAVDTKPFGVPGRACSDTFWFRVPTFTEIYRNLARQQDNTEQTLDNIRSRQKGVSEQLDQVMRTSQGRKELSWEQRQILRDVKEQLQEQADSLSRSVQALRETVERMKQQGSIGEECSRKFDQVRSAVEELVKQFGDSLLFSMKDIDKPVSMSDIRNAVEQARSQLPDIEEQLDNTLKFLKMLKEDRVLSELAMKAEALAKEQSSLAREADTRSPDARRQRELLDRIGKLSKDAVDQVRERNTGEGTSDPLHSRQSLDSLGRAMRSGLDHAAPPSSEAMDRMSGSLLSLSQELMQMMNSGAGRRLEKERGRLLSLAKEALTMADWQKELLQSQDRESLAASQQALRDALKQSKTTADSLSMVPPDRMAEIGKSYLEAERSSEAALRSIDNVRARHESMNGNVAALRAYAGSFLTALSQLGDGRQPEGSSGSGMMGGLRKISGRQASINGITGSLLSSLMKGSSPGGANGGSSESARRAVQNAQREIADALKRLADRYGNEPGNGGLAGRVSELEKEARNLAGMLDHPQREVTDRQDRLLSRMLETTLSLHRQEEGKEQFKSQSADNTFREGITAQPGTLFRDRDSFNRLRLQAFQGNYPEAYREALLKYFEALSEKYLK